MGSLRVGLGRGTRSSPRGRGRGREGLLGIRTGQGFRAFWLNLILWMTGQRRKSDFSEVISWVTATLKSEFRSPHPSTVAFGPSDKYPLLTPPFPGQQNHPLPPTSPESCTL